jgi:hypothetical protein
VWFEPDSQALKIQVFEEKNPFVTEKSVLLPERFCL